MRLLSGLLIWFLLLVPGWAQREFVASDASLKLVTNEEFDKTFNPHAILSLVSPYDTVVVVTKGEIEGSIETIYDQFPRTLVQGQECVGRIMLSVDGEQGPSFVIEGMFPPEGEPTHQTLLTVVNLDKHCYTFMIHYPLDQSEEGLEFAHQLLSSVRWLR